MNEKITAYYDGKCNLCMAEISYYMKKDRGKKIHFVDISNNFSPEEHGLDEDVYLNLHVKLVDGQICKGVDAFIAIWKNIDGFAILAKIFDNRLVNPIAHVGYFIFARIRPYLPRKKDNLCSSGTCVYEEKVRAKQ